MGRLRTDFTLQRMVDANVHQRIDDYSVEADDCDAHGFMDLSNGVHLPFAKMPIKFARQGKGVSKEEERDNAKWSDMSVAIVTMESRQHIFATPRLGDTVHTRSIHAHVGEKSLNFNHWVFNKETGEPYALLAQFGLGFDLDARKTIPFPDDMRANLERHMYPEFSNILAEEA